MKKYGILLAILALVFVSLARQSLSGGGNSDVAEPAPVDAGGADTQAPAVEEPAAPESPAGGGVESEFTIPDGAVNIQNIANTLNFQVEMSLD